MAEYAQRENKNSIEIEARDPPRAGNPMQLAAFAADLSRDTGITGFSFHNWNTAFNALGALAQDKQWVILLDEITWLAKYSEECLAELKVFIDRYIHGSGNRLIICGSVSQWIEQQINESDLFVGRISKKIRLAPLALPDCAEFWAGREVSSREILTALCVVGGVPRYLEEINALQSAEWNVQKLCFDPSGYMVHELPNLIKSSFINAAREDSLERYIDILASLSEQGKTLADISAAIRVENNESLKNNLSGLALSGIVSENPSWNLKNKALNKRNLHYRIEDPYTRFYIKYIRPNLNEIEKGLYRNVTLKQLPSWEAIRGFQFESLVNQCMIPTIIRKLKLTGVPIRRSGPYFQKATAQRRAVQIDYLLQTDEALYVCETKFRKRIEPSVIDEVKEKIQRLETAPDMTIRRVLLYSGERADALTASIYFDHQISIDDLLRHSDA